jgi:hypothetical protein
MTHMFKLARRVARLRAAVPVALVAALGACDGTDRLVNTPDEPAAIAPPTALSLSTSFRGGIPFGVAHLPTSEYGTIYNGAVRKIYAKYLLADLEAARKAGTRLVLSFAGVQDNYQNSNKSFSVAKWKAKVDGFRQIDFSSYIADGTIIGHYLFDEPHDPANWGGRTVSPATIEEVAKYSKQLWPTLPTIIRSWPAYLKGYKYTYLDAAWAQYSERQGPVGPFLSNNVRDAKAAGLALVVAMNLLDGGTSASGMRGPTRGKYSMSASQLRSWGSGLLADPYPCAFISWKYDAKYLGRSDIKSAMAALSQQARQHASRSCSAGTQDPVPPPVEPPPVEPPVVQPPVVQPPVVQPPVVQPPVVQPPVVQPPDDDDQPDAQPSTNPSIRLTVTGRTEKKTQLMTLVWSGANGSRVDVYRNGELKKTTENDRHYTNARRKQGNATYVYKVCERGTSKCSNEATVRFR